MKHLLAAMLLAPIPLLAQENPSYDPDYNGDGCYSIPDVLGLLPLFGECAEPGAMWACGDSLLFDDHWYQTVQIAGQCWFAENLQTTAYADGTQIGEISNFPFWYLIQQGEVVQGACGVYQNDYSQLDQYGRLYNWYAVNDSRGLCPSGWNVPAESDFNDLTNAIHDYGYWPVFQALASPDWPVGVIPNLSGTVFIDSGSEYTNPLGFNLNPAGFRGGLAGSTQTMDQQAGIATSLWSSSANVGRWLPIGVFENPESVYSWSSNGYSVRCVKEIPLGGCTDSSYTEFNSLATQDDGSCITTVVGGCNDPRFVEYSVEANIDWGCETLLGCSNDDFVSFDGFDYSVVTIGNQCWFKENLRTTLLADGTPIAQNLSAPDTTVSRTVFYGQETATCPLEAIDTDTCNEAAVVSAFGRLYNSPAVRDSLGLCPNGWHVPSLDEWYELGGYVASKGFYGDDIATSLRANSGWAENVGTEDVFGFAAVPAGQFWQINVDEFAGVSLAAGSHAKFWSSSTLTPGNVTFEINDETIGVTHSGSAVLGFHSVRCLRDSE